MKTTTAELDAHLGQPCITVCTLVKIVRKDGTVFAYTDHDTALVFGGVPYLPQFGLSRKDVQGQAEISPNDVETSAFIDDDRLTHRDLRGKLFDGSDVEIRAVNWADLTQGALKFVKGTFGEFVTAGGLFTVQVQGLAQKLNTVLGNTYGPSCRAQLGDAKCGINMATYRQAGSVASSADAYTLTPAAGLLMTGSDTPDADAPTGWFDDGLVTFTSGENTGLSYQVATWDGTVLVIRNPLFAHPAPGATFTIEPGCNHSGDPDTGDCFNKYNNIINFRGEPFMPLDDQVTDFPDVATE